MFAALVDVGERLKLDPGVRAVVLSGRDGGFAPGSMSACFRRWPATPGRCVTRDWRRRHVSATRTVDHAPRTTGGLGLAGTAHACDRRCAWRGLRAGIQLAVGADIRFVVPDAQFSVLEIRWGLTPDMTATVTLTDWCHSTWQRNSSSPDASSRVRRPAGSASPPTSLVRRWRTRRAGARELRPRIPTPSTGQEAPQPVGSGLDRGTVRSRTRDHRRSHWQPQSGRGGKGILRKAPTPLSRLIVAQCQMRMSPCGSADGS